MENTYIYTVENRLKAVYDANELIAAMAYDGDGNRIFQLNYNLHTDDDWKDNNGNGNGNNKDNTGSGNSGNGNGNSSEASTAETGESLSIAQMLLDVRGLGGVESTAAESVETAEEEAVETAATAAADEETSAAEVSEEPAADAAQDDQLLSIFSGIPELASEAQEEASEALAALEGITLPETESVTELEGIDIEALSTDKANDNGNNGNNGNGNSSSDNNGNANGNTNNTGGSQNQSGILFPETEKVSELEQEMIDMIKTEGKHKNYELIEYVNDVNRKYTEVLMELNINGIMDTAYSYGNERLTVERFDGWTGYYTYDPRGSVSGVTGADGYLWQSYRYDAYGNITFGAPQYNNEYTYNAESYNPNLDVQYLRARYYSPSTANFLTEDRYLGSTVDPLTQNRYNYAKSSPLNYADPSGNFVITLGTVIGAALIGGAIGMTISIVHQVSEDGKVDLGDTLKATFIGSTGGAVAMVTASLVGAGFAAAGITSAFTVSQAFAIGATTSAASGIAVRANTALLEGVVLPEKEPALKLPTLEDTIKEILDPGAVTFDAAMGGVANALLFEIQQAVNKQQVAACDEIEEDFKTYKEVNIHGKINTELDEIDLKNKIIYEDKNASKLYMDNPDYPQTEMQWAEKQIFKKGKNRIEALQQDEFRLSSQVSSDLPAAEELKEIKDYVFRIDADTQELRSAVQIQLDKLSELFPEFNFSATYGG